MVRAVVRICPNVSFHPSILPSSTPRYFYEATDLENFKLYESNVRHCGLESRVDMIYDQNCSQYDFFEKEVSKYVQMAVRGTDSSVLLLGCPHGGRRYSLEGTSEYPGLYFRSLDMILSSIKSNKHQYRLRFSCCIIERDVIVDSLPEKGSKYQIRLRDDPIYGIVPEGLNWKVIHNVQSGMQMLRESSLKINQKRSHLIVSLSVENFQTGQQGTLNFVSLGSIFATQMNQPSSGVRSKDILLVSKWFEVLNSCLSALESRTSAIVQFHKSKLSMFLRDYLIGRKEAIVLCCLSPNMENYQTAKGMLNLSHRLKRSCPEIFGSLETKDLLNKELIETAHQRYHRMKFEQEKSKQVLKAQNKYLELTQNQVLVPSQNFRTPGILYDSERPVLHGESLTESEDFAFPIPLNATPKIQDDFENEFQVYEVRGDNTFTPRRSRRLIERSEQKRDSIEPNRTTPPHREIPKNKKDQIQAKDEEIEKLRAEKEELQRKINSLEEEALIKERKYIDSQEKQRVHFEHLMKMQEQQVRQRYTKKETARLSIDKKNNNDIPLTTPRNSEESRYTEVMESAIKRMKLEINDLEIENENLKKSILKKDAELLKKRTSAQMKTIGDISLLRKSFAEAQENIEKLKNKLNQMKRCELAWANERKQLINTIERLENKGVKECAPVEELSTDNINYLLDQQYDTEDEIMDQTYCPSSEESSEMISDLDQEYSDNPSISKREEAEKLRNTLVKALSRTRPNKSLSPPAYSSSPIVFEMGSPPMLTNDEPSTTSIFIESDPEEEELFEMPRAIVEC